MITSKNREQFILGYIFERIKTGKVTCTEIEAMACPEYGSKQDLKSSINELIKKGDICRMDNYLKIGKVP